jgi:predicted ATPase/DNA-binding winged helix-turn-helix (wHTH) protein
MLIAPGRIAQGAIAFGPFRLCAAERLIERSGEPVELGSRAMDILIALVERAGEVVSQRDLIDRVWPNVTVDDSNLRTHVVALRRALRDGQDGARYVINVPGRGYCFVCLLERSPSNGSLPAPIGPASAVPVIPPRLRHMVGRDCVVELIAAQLARQRFVTIVGPGGIGKTTVAVSVGHALASDCAAACFVDLGPLTDPRLVPSLLATALGLVVQSDDPLPSLIAFLRDRRMLLILDSCEHVIEAAAGLAKAIFEQAEQVHILATSREALRVEGEHMHRLAPLDCPPASDTLTAAEALAFPAVQLFYDRVAANVGGIVLQDADAPVVARICRRLDGIALAIELAAGRVDAYGIDGVETALDGRLSLLWQGRRTAPPRHHTLNAALGWSYDLLADVERAVLRRLAVFAGPFTLEAAQAVAGDNGLAADEIVEVIASLVAKSLIASETRARKGARYRLLDTTCTFLRAKLTGTDGADVVARRHAAFFCDFLERGGTQGAAYSEAPELDALGEHLGNIRAALEWSFSERGDVSLGVALAAGAAPLFLGMSLLTECRRWTETALAAHAGAGADSRREMELQAALGLSLIDTEGNSANVRDALQRALDLAEGLGELRPQSRLIGSLHLFHARTGDFPASIQWAERALSVAKAMADPARLAEAEWMWGMSHHLAGDQSSALVHCQGALSHPAAGARAQVVRVGFDQRISALCTLCRTQWLRGYGDDAVETARYALAEAEALGHPATLCVALLTIALVFLWIRNLSEVEAIIERMISIAEKYALGPHHTLALALRGGLAVRQGEAAAVIPQLSSCLHALHAGRYGVHASVFTSYQAEAMAMAGRIDDALATIANEISKAEGKGGSFDLPELWRLKGEFLLNRDPANAAEAEHCFRRSIELAHRQEALSWELRTATSMAQLRSSQGRRAEAHEGLAAVFGRFTQGKGTADLRAAGSLRDALA